MVHVEVEVGAETQIFGIRKHGKKGLPPRLSRLKISVFECSAVISAYEKVGQWELALAFLQRIPAFCLPNLACVGPSVDMNRYQPGDMTE